MADHVEPLLAAGIIHRRDVDDADETTGGIIAQEFDDLDDFGGIDRDRELIKCDRVSGYSAR